MSNPAPSTHATKDAKLYVYGASGHGKVVADIALASGYQIHGFIDDSPSSSGKQVLGLPVLGSFEWLAKRARQCEVAVALGVGNNHARYRVAEQCRRLDIPLITLIHPSAVISSSATIGRGTVLMARVVVNAEARVGESVILNTGAIVEHDCEVGNDAHLSPNSAMGGASSLGMRSWLGMGAVIIHGVSVGANSVVGAGAVVIQNLPDNVVAVGVPARISHGVVHAEEFRK